MSLLRLRAGEWLAGAAAIVLFVAVFALHWYAGAHPRSGWQALPILRWLIVATVAVCLVTVLAQARPGPALAAALDVVALVLSSLTAMALAIRLATGGGSFAAGAVVGLVASIALTAGVFLALRTEQGWPPGPERPIEVVSLGPAEER